MEQWHGIHFSTRRETEGGGGGGGVPLREGRFRSEEDNSVDGGERFTERKQRPVAKAMSREQDRIRAIHRGAHVVLPALLGLPHCFVLVDGRGADDSRALLGLGPGGHGGGAAGHERNPLACDKESQMQSTM